MPSPKTICLPDTFVFPQVLLEIEQWIWWRLEERGDPPKPTKVPYNPLRAGKADSTDPGTWGPFEAAWSVCVKQFGIEWNPASSTQGGIGIVLPVILEGRYVLFTDLDKCIENGEVQDWAREHLQALDSFSEFSPSGRGIHSFSLVDECGRGRRKGQVEMYTQSRFATVTGRPVPGMPLTVEYRQEQVETIIAEHFGPDVDEYRQPGLYHSGAVTWSDEELLERIRRSKKGDRFERLWGGDISEYGEDDSRADQALCNHLAFWTGCDAGRMDRLFRQSGLMREKWAVRADYREGTIEKAISGCPDPYSTEEYETVDIGKKLRQRRQEACSGHLSAESEGGEGLIDIPPDHLSKTHYPAYPYYRQNGQTMYIQAVGTGDTRKGNPIPVCDFVANITVDATTEDGQHLWTIEGHTIFGRRFSTEIKSTDATDARKLKAELAGPVGPEAPINARMEGHLPAAIQRFTAAHSKVQEIRQYNRTGWIDTDCNHFLIPGYRESADIRIRLEDRLPYDLSGGGLDEGLAALELLLLCKPAFFSTVLLSSVLAGPVGRVAGWDNDRYATFVTGITGSYKTTLSTLYMAVFGSRFAEDSLLRKWGDGATSNALQATAACASDMPFLIDNYKPNTGRGEIAFIGLMMNMLEGGEKARLNRDSRLRPTKEIHCWPLCTGEDTPSSDSATVARLLVLQAQREETDLSRLTRVQALTEHLPAIGRVWISWLESEEGQARVREIAREFTTRRFFWRDLMASSRPDAMPHSRTASNLAVNELIGRMIGACPTLKDVWERANPFDAHQQALETIAKSMAGGTVEATEAHRFISTLKSLLMSGRALLAPRSAPLSGSRDPDRVIGWEDGGGGWYLDYDLAMLVIEKARGKDYLGQISPSALHRQLDRFGFLGERNPDRLTKVIKLTDRTSVRAIHIQAKSLLNLDDSEQEDDD